MVVNNMNEFKAALDDEFINGSGKQKPVGLSKGFDYIAGIEPDIPEDSVWRNLQDIKLDSGKTILVFCLTHDDKRFEYNLYKLQPNSLVAKIPWTVKVGDTQYKFVSVNQNLDGLQVNSYIMSNMLRSFGTSEQLIKAKHIGEISSKFGN